MSVVELAVMRLLVKHVVTTPAPLRPHKSVVELAVMRLLVKHVVTTPSPLRPHKRVVELVVMLALMLVVTHVVTLAVTHVLEVGQSLLKSDTGGGGRGVSLQGKLTWASCRHSCVEPPCPAEHWLAE